MSNDPSAEITTLLQNWAQGDQGALHALIPVVHRELRLIAHRHLRAQRPDHTLQSGALVNEAFLRLLGSQPLDLRDRAHFMAVASRMMRQILVDYSRNRGAQKRDAGVRAHCKTLDDLFIGKDQELIALDDALTDLARLDARQAQVVEMRFFGGMAAPEIAEVLGISRATVEREWATARIWLFGHLREPNTP